MEDKENIYFVRDGIMTNSQVQEIAKQTMAYAKSVVCPQMSLIELRQICEAKMIDLGADSFWYWDIGAFVFSGNETTLSVSGREYKTSNRLIQESDIITIDLSPQKNSIWGDYARTIVIENGKVVEKLEHIINTQWQNGLKMEKILHEELLQFVDTTTTFEELFLYMNRYIVKKGYKQNQPTLSTIK